MMDDQLPGTRIVVKLTQEDNPAIERGLEDAFRAALLESGNSKRITTTAGHLIGGGCIVALEAERGAWSRYRVGFRVQGKPVTIATVEVTLPR